MESYTNEFIYFDMMAGARRLQTEARATDRKNDICKINVIEECTKKPSLFDTALFIQGEVESMKAGMGKCISLGDIKRAKISPRTEHVDLMSQRYLENSKIQKIRDSINILNGDNVIALDEYGEIITVGDMVDTDRIIKERLLEEDFKHMYYIITSTGLVRYIAGINTKENMQYSKSLMMKRFILFGRIK